MLTKQQIVPVLGESWAELLWEEFNQPYMGRLQRAVKKDRSRFTIWPKKEDVFRAFQETPYDELKVVIIGQDPYFNPGLATGLSFSVSNDTFDKDVPPSLKNILKEVEDDCGFKDPYPEIDLTRWAKQGVLLLNRSLTVRERIPNSHSHLGWYIFTERVVEVISKGPRFVVFLLWGSNARQMDTSIDLFDHITLQASHPSPRSAHVSFFGCKHFSKCNKWLTEEYGEGGAIKW